MARRHGVSFDSVQKSGAARLSPHGTYMASRDPHFAQKAKLSSGFICALHKRQRFFVYEKSAIRFGSSSALFSLALLGSGTTRF